MYVVPQSVVKFYRDIPFNEDYKHTIWFANISAQNSFFASKLAYTFNNFTYVRQTGVIRVPRIADDLYNCNYVSFLNAGFGSKTFYAFITKVEYVNNETTDVYFSLDYIQTWLFELTVEQCYVEREHVADDTVGKHTIEENLPTGEYIIENETSLKSENPAVMIILPQEGLGTLINNQIGNILNTTFTYSETAPNYSFITDKIKEFSETPEKVASIKMIVSDMIDPTQEVGVMNKLQTFENPFNVSRSQNVVFHNTCEGTTYTPKNNKLKCYPYCCFTVDNFNGDVTQYRWEEFTNPFSANFKERGTPYPVPTMECFPVDFKRKYSSPVSGYTKQYRTVFDNFPEIPMSTDTFKIWSSSQFKKDMNSSGASAVTRTVANVMGMVGNPLNILSSEASILGNYIQQQQNLQTDLEYHELHNCTLTGSLGNAGLCWNDNEVGFRFTQYQIKAEFARMIDDFLTRFGYKVNAIKVPELTSRRYFNYVKTVDASVRGNLPSECQKMIASIFDSGITLWHTNDVGNYNVNNSIVG